MFLVILYMVLQGINSPSRNVAATADQWSLFSQPSKSGLDNPMSTIIKNIQCIKKNPFPR